MTDPPRYDDFPALLVAALPPATGDAAPDGGRVYTYTSPPSALPDRWIYLNDAAAQFCIVNAMAFSVAADRVVGALRGIAAGARALERLGDSHPIGQAIIDGFIAGLHDARPRRVRPPRRAARRAHARRVAKRH